MLLHQLCNYLTDVLIVACFTLNITQCFSGPSSEIDWLNQSELWENRRPANPHCVRESVCVAGDVPGHEHMYMFVRKSAYRCVCVCDKVYRADSWACSEGLPCILPVWEATSAQSIRTGI